MIVIEGEVVGTERVLLGLASAPAVERIGKTVQVLGLELIRVVKGIYLTGAALGVRTGRLRRSVNAVFSQNGTQLSSSVGTNVEYGRFWEMGFKGTEQVKAFSRITGAGKTSLVRAHLRQVNQAARPFLQPALEDMGPRIHSALAAAAAPHRNQYSE